MSENIGDSVEDRLIFKLVHCWVWPVLQDITHWQTETALDSFKNVVILLVTLFMKWENN